MRASRLIKKIGIYFIGMMSSKILSVLLIPIYAFYVEPDVLGYYDYVLTIIGVLIPFIYLAIWEAILRFLLSEENLTKKNHAISTAAIFSLIMTSILIVGLIISNRFFEIEILTFILISMMFVCNGLSSIWQYFARGFEESKVFVLSSITGTIINFISILVLILILQVGLHGLLIAYTFGQLSIFIFIESKLKILKKIKITNFKFSLLKKMLLFSSPLVLNLTSIWLMTAFGRYLIYNKLGTEANGLFSFANKFSLIITLIGSVVTSAIIEEAIILAKTKGFDLRFKKSLETIFQIFQSIALIGVPLIIIFYSTIQGTEYYSSMVYFPWLIVYAVIHVMSSNLGSVFQAINKTKYQFTTTVSGAIVTVFTSYVLIEFLDVYAIIIGQLLGAATMLLSRYEILKRFTKLKINWIPTLGMCILFIAITWISLKTPVIFSFVTFILISTVVIYINRKNINVGLELIKNKFAN